MGIGAVVRELIGPGYGLDLEEVRFSLAHAAYWWLTDHHEGQWSENYRP